MGNGNIFFSNNMKICLDILNSAIQNIKDPVEFDKADYAIKYLLETSRKGIEPITPYDVARGCPTAERRIKTGIESFEKSIIDRGCPTAERRVKVGTE